MIRGLLIFTVHNFFILLGLTLILIITTVLLSILKKKTYGKLKIFLSSISVILLVLVGYAGTLPLNYGEPPMSNKDKKIISDKIKSLYDTTVDSQGKIKISAESLDAEPAIPMNTLSEIATDYIGDEWTPQKFYDIVAHGYIPIYLGKHQYTFTLENSRKYVLVEFDKEEDTIIDVFYPD